MHLSRLRTEERGGILVMASAMIPVFLIFAALVVDVGNWYTHKRQLQNRADAGALAAGRELADRWPGCITDATSEAVITAVAKRFAGDPNDVSAVNTEIVYDPSTRFNVVVNGADYDTDFTDNATVASSKPCQDHPATPGPESEANVTPQGGTWVDVKVRERNTASLFGSFGVDLLQNRARARVELLETHQTNEFIPIAIPEQAVEKARVLFVNMCNNSVLASSDLAPLEAAYQTVSGMSLWGPDPTGSATTVTPGTVSMSTPGTVPVPNTPGASACGDSFLDHTPVRVELRLAGRKDIDLSNTVSCGTLQSMTAADCYSQISKVRVYRPTGGLFGDRPQVRDVTFSPSGARPCTLDAYYSRSTATPNCTFDATVFMDWGSRPTGPAATFEATISVDGSAARDLSGPTPQGNWTASQVPISALGPDWVKVSWTYTLRSGSWPPGGMTGCTDKKPCVRSGTTTVHAANLGNEPGGADSPSDVVGAVKLTQGPSTTSVDLHSAETNVPFSPYVTIGLRTVFKTGDWSVLRLDQGTKNFSVICDPWWPQPSSVDAEAAFYFGCLPPYGKNNTNTTTPTFWWDPGTKTCPVGQDWWKNNPPTGTWPNQQYAPEKPWKCVLLDTGGNGQTTGDGIALATENCTASKVDVAAQPGPGAHAKCKSSDYTCYNPPTYFGTGAPPSSDDPRLVKLFVVPWNAYKNVSVKEVVPILRLAGFYITSWRFNSREDPCYNLNAQTLAEYNRLGVTGDKLSGYFVKEVETSGVGNPTRKCDPTSIELCTVVMSR